MLLRIGVFCFLVLHLASCKNQRSSSPDAAVIPTDTVTVSDTYYKKGSSYYKNGDLENARRFYKLAIDSCTSLDATMQFKLYQSLIGTYLFKNEYGDALAVLQEYEAKKLMPEQEHKLIVLSTKQVILISSKQFEEAFKVNTELQELSIFLKDESRKNYALLSRINMLLELNRNDEAEDLTTRLIDSDDINDFQKALIASQRGIRLFYQRDYKEAILNYQKSLDFHKNSSLDGIENAMATQFANIAEAYIELQNYRQAEIYLDSFKLLDQGKVSNNLRKSVFKYELRLARALDVDNRRIEELIDKTATNQELLYKAKFDKELESLTREKEKSESLLLEKQKAEVEKLQVRNKALMLGAALLLILIASFFMIYKQRKNYLIDSLLKQQRLLRAQMNPHFLFNVLSSIQNLMKSDSILASRFITKFSRLLRTVLENSMHNQVPIIDEIAVIKNYLDLQQLRFPDLFDYEIVLEENLQSDFIMIPPMLLQPFVENAIEHGFKGIDYKGHVSVRLAKNNQASAKLLHCTITDNGNGFSKEVNPRKKSVSTLLIADFIKKTTGEELTITRAKNTVPYGTEVSFTILSS